MRKIENFAQISDLLNAQLKRGVLTNNFLRGDDYTREIANGLYIHEADGALLLFRERGDHLVIALLQRQDGRVAEVRFASAGIRSCTTLSFTHFL